VSVSGVILTVKGVNHYLENACLCMFFLFFLFNLYLCFLKKLKLKGNKGVVKNITACVEPSTRRKLSIAT